MMTLHVLHAGDGYSYLTRQVASADRQRERGQQLTDYYTAHGTPPGQWAGSGLAALSEISSVSGEVTEAQMKALFGEGRHPNTDAMLVAGVDLKDTALGRKFAVFKNENAFRTALTRAISEAEESLERALTAAEQRDIERSLAPAHFEAQTGNPAKTERELAAWMAKQRTDSRQPVAGYDCVFTPQKSVSVLWGLADNDTRKAIERIHSECVTDALHWIETESAFTRRGDRSQVQIDTTGLIVAQFNHYDTRAGDPNLHTHCAISNKVLGSDGKWSALDGATLHRHAVAASQRYNSTLVDRLRRDLGLQFEARYPRRGRPPVWEVAGIDPDLSATFSSRRTDIEARYNELIAGYRRDHHRSPSRAAHYRLLQQATLDTRDGKTTPRSLHELRQVWRATAAKQLGSDTAVDAMITRALNPEHNPAATRFLDTIEEEADIALATVSDERADWKHAHVLSVVEAQIANVNFDSPAHKDDTVQAITRAVESRRSVPITTPEKISATLPASLLRASGESVFQRHGEESFTSNEILDCERSLLAAAHHITTEFTTKKQLSKAIKHQKMPLNAGQQELASHLCLSGNLVAAGVGPAGTGKTTAMAAVSAAWTASGRRVILLAPSAVAAENLRQDIGEKAYTVAAFTYRWRGKLEPMGYRGRDLSALPKRIRAGDMLLVDEAAMVSTKDLHALTEIASRTGAVVRLVGDPAQLDSVETGGIMRLITSETFAPRLKDVVRFGDDHQQSKASQLIRQGSPRGLALYREREWIHGGDKAPLMREAVYDHLRDTHAGRDSILLASTVDTVRDLNRYIQDEHRAEGTVKAHTTVTLSDGLTAGRGDIIVTRSNNPDLHPVGGTRPGARVANGDRWKVTRVHKNGRITVRHLHHRGRVTLPPTYISAAVELGYAATVHRAQGITVDVSRTIVDGATDRRGLYVALTRGRHENHSYVVDIPLDLDTEKMHILDDEDEDEQLPPEDPIDRAHATLKAALERDDGHTTATEAVREALAAADDPQLIADRYTAARNLLVNDYVAALLDDLPAALTAELRQDPSAAAAWRDACDRHLAAGHDLNAAITAVRDEVLDDLTTEPTLPDSLPETTRRAIERDPEALALVLDAARVYTADGVDHTDAIQAAIDDLMDGSLHRAAADDSQPPVPEDQSTPPGAENQNRRSLITRITAHLDPAPIPTHGTLLPLPPRYPGMDTELADYATAALTEHARLLSSGEDTSLTAPDHRSLIDAARDRITSRKVTLLDDQALTDTHRRLRAQINTLTSRLSQLDQLAADPKAGTALDAVQAEHRQLDQRMDAISRARAVHQQQIDAEQAVAGWDNKRTQLSIEQRRLGPFASRRREELSREMSQAQHEHQRWSDIAKAARSQSYALRADAGPTNQWAAIESRARDTATRDRQLADAVAADHQRIDTARTEHENLTARLDKARRGHEVTTRELRRRSELTDAERTAEHHVRTELAPTDAHSPVTAPTHQAPAPDYGPSHDHGPEL